MERAISSEERIRRAEEIYNRRKMQNGVRVPTARVNTTVNNKYSLYKKLILQILICFLLYFVFYLIKNSNYIFSEECIKKTKEFLSYDINFGNTYNQLVEYYNKNIKSHFITTKDENNIEDVNIEQNTNEQENVEVNTQEGGIGGGEDNVEVNAEETSEETTLQLSQMDVDANEIKEKYNFILPLLGTITSRYGPRQQTEIVSANHAGIDIGANEGTVFVAAMSGTVVVSSGEGTYGNHIFIQEGDVITVYAHCKKLYVQEGDKVIQGQQIGEVGATGNATGPHLHFEIRKSGRIVNPELILQFT